MTSGVLFLRGAKEQEFGCFLMFLVVISVFLVLVDFDSLACGVCEFLGCLASGVFWAFRL
jgi:hypothetical protein